MTRVASSVRVWVRRLLWVPAVLVALAMAAPVLSGEYQLHPVLTGSMRPGFALGSVVVVKRVPVQSVAVRDVILFHKPGHPSEYVVHRVVDISRKAGQRVIETKGDNNPVKDPWQVALVGRHAYRAQFTIPFLGYAALYAHRPQTRRFGLYVAAALMLWAAVSALRSREQEPLVPRVLDEVPVAAGDRRDGSVLADTADATSNSALLALRLGGRTRLYANSPASVDVDGGRW